MWISQRFICENDTYEHKNKNNLYESEEALVKAYRDVCEFQNKIKGRFIKNQFEEFDKEVQLIKGNLPYELKDGYTNTLTGVFQMIRNNRKCK